MATTGRDQPAGAVPGQSRFEFAQFLRVQPALVLVTEIADPLEPCVERLQFGLALGHLDASTGLEATAVVDQFRDAMPELQRQPRQWQFLGVAADAVDPAGVDPGGMPAAEILLQHQYLHTAQREVHGGRQPLDAATDDQRIGAACRAHGCTLPRKERARSASGGGPRSKVIRVVSGIGRTGGRIRG